MLKVLIAEDNVMIADILEDFLVTGGFDVCDVVRTVDEAVTSADLHKPDLAVFDFWLADGGFGSQIKPRLKDPDSIGILYATGNGVTNALSRADGEAYIEKPYRMNDVIQALRIVHEIKATGIVTPPYSPDHFHLLEADVWKSA